MATMTRFRPSVESYAHKAAKAVLVQWLRGAAQETSGSCWTSFCGIEWRPNRGAPYHGVLEEYPFVGRDGHAPPWDEMGWWLNLQELRNPGSREGLLKVNDYTYGPEGRQNHPTYDELRELGMTPTAIVDVAVQHKGAITDVFEIVHKHGLTQRKRDFLRSLGCNIAVISADWILSQISAPKRLVRLEAAN